MFKRWRFTTICPGLPNAVFAPEFFATRRGAIRRVRAYKVMCRLFDYRLKNVRTGEEENL